MQSELLFQNILECDSIFSLADSLEEFLDNIATVPKKQQIFEALYHQINVAAFFARPEQYMGYEIYSSKGSVLHFLLNYWNFASTATKNRVLIKSIIEKIRKEFCEVESVSTVNCTIFDILSMVEEKLGYSTNLLRDDEIKILNLDRKHHEWNCFYSATLVPEKELIDDYIIMTQMQEYATSSREFVLLHELGHLLHTRLTLQLSMVPASFGEAIEKIISRPISDGEKAEMFADFFAFAVLWESSYEHDDYPELNDVAKKYLLPYFKHLIQQYD